MMRPIHEDMPKRAGYGGFKDRRVEHEDRACHRREAYGKQHEQFRPRDLREIGPDQKWRFDHAEKDRGCGAQPDRAADAHGLAQSPGETVDEDRKYAPMPKKSRKRRDHDYQR
jgi:hypothetical protein